MRSAKLINGSDHRNDSDHQPRMKIEGTRVMYRRPESKAEMELRGQNAPMSEQILLAYLQ